MWEFSTFLDSLSGAWPWADSQQVQSTGGTVPPWSYPVGRNEKPAFTSPTSIRDSLRLAKFEQSPAKSGAFVWISYDPTWTAEMQHLRENRLGKEAGSSRPPLIQGRTHGLASRVWAGTILQSTIQKNHRPKPWYWTTCSLWIIIFWIIIFRKKLWSEKCHVLLKLIGNFLWSLAQCACGEVGSGEQNHYSLKKEKERRWMLGKQPRSFIVIFFFKPRRESDVAQRFTSRDFENIVSTYVDGAGFHAMMTSVHSPSVLCWWHSRF